MMNHYTVFSLTAALLATTEDGPRSIAIDEVSNILAADDEWSRYDAIALATEHARPPGMCNGLGWGEPW
jgi:hypothetical protein